jgi:hypothetical protein
MAAISDIFGDIVISESLWPAHSPDLMPCAFYLWGSLKDKVYKINPNTLHKLEENIQEEISKIFPAELQHVKQSTFSCCSARLKHKLSQIYIQVLRQHNFVV